MITVGMNYQIKEGQEQPFRALFAKVLTVMDTFAGHRETRLLQDVFDTSSYTIFSEWSSEEDYQTFTSSPEFSKVTTWGMRVALKQRPTHDLYHSPDEITATRKVEKCPMTQTGH